MLQRRSPGFPLAAGTIQVMTLLAGALLPGCSDTLTQVVTLDVPGESCQYDTARKVLFIGNSYTYRNNLPGLVKDLACSAGVNIETTSATRENSRFADLAGDRTVLDTIGSAAWDFVVLQNHSLVASFPPEELVTDSLPHAIELADAVALNNPATQLVYYVTQGRKNGDVQHCPTHPEVCTFAGHTAALIDGYMIYRDATGGELALAGSAWKAVVDDAARPVNLDDLWAADASHPTLTGSYLSAGVLFATMFDRSPVGFDGPSAISDIHVLYLQQIAAAATGF